MTLRRVVVQERCGCQGYCEREGREQTCFVYAYKLWKKMPRLRCAAKHSSDGVIDADVRQAQDSVRT